MSFINRIGFIVLALAFFVANARAQDAQGSAAPAASTSQAPAPAGSTGSALTPYSTRPITLPRGTLRIDVAPPDYGYMEHGELNQGRGLRIAKWGEGSDTAVGLGVGAAYGILNELEAGGLIFPFVFAPDFDFGDMELYGRYAFFRNSNMDIGAQLVLRIPTASDFGMGIGVPAKFRFDSIRLDTGIELEMIFASHDAHVNLDVPCALNFDIAGTAFIGPRTGLFFPRFKDLAINLGIQGGVTVVSMVDITGSFNFPAFLGTGSGDAVNVDTFEIMLGANIHLKLL